MKIFLAEERDGKAHGEHGFERSVIKVGRDKKDCQIIFDDAKWPMVSRRHAEIRLEKGRYLLVDNNSTQGTYVDGKIIKQPVELKAGARIQFGPNGPKLCVVRIEQPVVSTAPSPPQPQQPQPQPPAAKAQPQPKPQPQQPAVAQQPPKVAPQPPAPQQPPQQQRPQQPQPQAPQPQAQVPQPVQPQPAPKAPAQKTPAPKTPAQVSQLPSIEWINDVTGQLQRFQISTDLTRIGRDLNMDVRFEGSAAVVSRQHAEIKRNNGQFVLIDKGSFNGTYHNSKRITAETPLRDGDRIQLGIGGPICLFRDPAHPATHPAPTPAPAQQAAAPPAGQQQPTILAPTSSPAIQQPASGGVHLDLIDEESFDRKPQIQVGRAPGNDIQLEGLQISNRHARISRESLGVFIEDLGSTNGVYVNGTRITTKVQLNPDAVVQIGPFLFQIDSQRVAVYDTRAKTRIDVKGVTKVVRNRSGAGTIKLLDDIDLVIQPNEFVGLLGPSGAGKSTLMDALNGMRPATSGNVLVNNLDLYQHFDSHKQSIGYVPQDDIIHRELTVYRTLYYVAYLRLSRDVTEPEIDMLVGQVMDVTGLSERRDVPVGQLSGGQRKRVSIAVELITKPSVIFLDEPTSGLDPATEEKIMKLFRQIAESGRTVILTTHAMENVRLFDKIVVLMRGKLVWYGAPHEALQHVKASSFKDLYDKLEAQIADEINRLPPLPANAAPQQLQARKQEKEQIAEKVAEGWKARFKQTEQYKRLIQQPLAQVTTQSASAVVTAPRRHTVTDRIWQWKTLAQRYYEVLSRDKLNLLILFGQAPIIAILTALVVGAKSPRDFPYFMLALVAIWFGTSIAAREIIRERAIYNRERMVNLGILPYIGSKLLVLSVIVGVQCVLLFLMLKLFGLVGWMKMPGEFYGLPQLALMILTGMVGIAIGLFISALVKTSEMATSLVPLILIPQILFSGLVGVPKGVSKYVGVLMPATWSFDGMKRLSALDVLRGKDEGAQPSAKNEGRGLYKNVEHQNKQTVREAQDEIDNHQTNVEQQIQDFKKRMEEYQTEMVKYRNKLRADEPVKPVDPATEKPKKLSEPAPIPDDMSDYVDFLHPWGSVRLDAALLLVMFIGFVGGTAAVLRSQDIC
ncbi:MAG: FHA domain-containing protein [Pyrinomonadaceae bacterium]|nr:FHA domain-containing protein [Pyrinomonadaceae bacterium]